jgi:pyruvate/2-oxoglutarate/acetoin dehydrogenase E1 component
MAMRTLTYREALTEALREELLRDVNVFLIGEDINGGPQGYGGAFKVTKALTAEFGDRLLDTPIMEQTIIGAAIGAAMTGSRPVAEIMYEDFLTLGMDLLVNTAAKTHFMTNGQYCVPMVVRAPYGALGIGPQHSQTFTSWFMHVPGLQVVLPATPQDAKGLLKTAIRSNDPVIFLEHKKLYNTKGEVPEEEYLIPFGQARKVTTGGDLTLVAAGYMVQLAGEAAEAFKAKGVEVEVIDVRTLAPLDLGTIAESVRKTHKAVVVAEDCRTAGPTAEIAAAIMDTCFGSLDAPVGRVGTKDTFIAHNAGMSEYAVPGSRDIQAAIQSVLDWA